MRQYYAWQSSFGLTIVTDVFYGATCRLTSSSPLLISNLVAVSLLLYILHIFGLIRSTWSLGIYIAGLVFTIIVLVRCLILYSSFARLMLTLLLSPSRSFSALVFLLVRLHRFSTRVS